MESPRLLDRVGVREHDDSLNAIMRFKADQPHVLAAPLSFKIPRFGIYVLLRGHCGIMAAESGL